MELPVYKLKTELPYDSDIPLLGIENHNSKWNMHHKVLHNTIYNSQDIKVKGVLNLRHTAT